MKKLQKAVCFLLAVIASVTFTACRDKDENPGGERSIIITIGETNYPVVTELRYLGAVLDLLAREQDLHIKTNGTAGSTMGRWIEEIGELIPNAGNEFVALYSSTDNLKHSDPLITKTIGGVKYFSALKGIDQMPVLDGVTYLFILDTF